MSTYTEYYKQRLLEQDIRYKNATEISILGKRSYKVAFGYTNDYETVQELRIDNLEKLDNCNWKDAFTENLCNK